jgi:RHS repeat-associated protein
LFGYDSTNKLISESNQNFLEVSYQYDGAGRLLNRILSNGAMTNYTWDADNRLLTLSNTTVTGSVVNSETYVRDWLGNITSRTDSSGITNFVYDADYRLTSATYPNSAYSQSFTYDKAGNRLTMAKGGGTPLYYSYDADNRLTQINLGSATGTLQNSFVYDNDNNLITKKDGSGNPTQALSYDPKGRTATITTSGVGISTTLACDPMDYRISKTDSKGSLTYLLEGERLDAIMNGSQFQADYMRGSVVDEVVNGYQYNPGNAWTNYTFHHDLLMSVAGLSDHEGNVLQTTTYDPFGITMTNIGVGSNNTLFYTGRELDQDSGLYYYRARYYDPSTGRFLTEDPKGFAAGINFYVYAKNNPINFSDPTGLIRWEQLGNATLGIFGNALGLGVSSALLTVPDPTLSTKVLGYVVGAKSAAGLALNANNLISSLSDSDTHDLPSSATRAIAQIAFPGDQNAQLLADAVDLSIDLVSGSGSNYPYGKPTLVDTGVSMPVKSFDSVDSLFEQPGIVKGFQVFQAAQVAYQDQTAVTESFSSSGSAAGGFLLYPNKPNTNMAGRVYNK